MLSEILKINENTCDTLNTEKMHHKSTRINQNEKEEPLLGKIQNDKVNENEKSNSFQEKEELDEIMESVLVGLISKEVLYDPLKEMLQKVTIQTLMISIKIG